MFPLHVSDNCPLLLDTEIPTSGPTPFRFENMWIRHKDFKANVHEWWSEGGRMGGFKFISSSATGQNEFGKTELGNLWKCCPGMKIKEIDNREGSCYFRAEDSANRAIES